MSRLGLYEIMKDQEADLIQSIERGLESSGTPHYQGLGPERLHQRVEGLVGHFLQSMHGDPTPFVEFIRGISEERISEGFHLRELQTALTMLEQRAWQLAIEHCTADKLIRCLSVITWTVGSAKDELARIYLEKSEKADRTIVDLETKLAELFKGTEGYVASE